MWYFCPKVGHTLGAITECGLVIIQHTTINPPKCFCPSLYLTRILKSFGKMNVRNKCRKRTFSLISILIASDQGFRVCGKVTQVYALAVHLWLLPGLWWTILEILCRYWCRRGRVWLFHTDTKAAPLATPAKKDNAPFCWAWRTTESAEGRREILPKAQWTPCRLDLCVFS